MMSATLDQPVKGPTFHPISPGRKIKNRVASSLFLIAFGIAVVPLVWVLWMVIERGWYAVTRSGWWTHSLQGGSPPRTIRRRRLPRDLRVTRPGGRCRRRCRAARIDGRGLLGGIRHGRTGESHYVHGGRLGRRTVDRCCAVHFSACGSPRWDFPRVRSRCRWLWCYSCFP